MITNNPDRFACYSIHVNDCCDVPWGSTRASFYGGIADGIPWFAYDGLWDAWPVNTYQSKLNQRLAVTTDVTISMSAAQVAGQTFNVTANVCIEAGGVGKTMRVYMVDVLDHWPTTPSYSRNCLMQASPTQDITLAPGECQQVVQSFTFSATSWSRQDDIKLIAWAQTPLPSWPALVHQAGQIGWPFGDPVPPPARPMADDAFDMAGTAVPCSSDADCQAAGDGASAQTHCVPPPTGDVGSGTCYVQRNRYISLNPNPANVGVVTARRVSLDLGGGSTAVLGWIGAPVETAVTGPEANTQLLAGLVAAPHYRDWGLDDLGQPWPDATIHVGACEISPTYTYLVQNIADGFPTGDEANYSEALVLQTTATYGDVVGSYNGEVPDNDRNFKDINSVVRGFQGIQTEPKVWLDLVGGAQSPECPGIDNLDFGDINAAVQGFQGAVYSMYAPLDCPPNLCGG